MSAKTVKLACGAKTSSVPRLDLIPLEAELRMAARFEKGMRRYGKNNWRAGLKNDDYVAERIAHLKLHVARFLAKLEGRIPDDGEDDAGAILWAGAFLACRTTCKCGATMSPAAQLCGKCSKGAQT